ncbi:hypothetical protein BTA51_02005 [Hahella sp. CCB-MM4]|uniref:hypothetical protein n=1 Tax=Hahella sp. (strain CCB-MM4) TaxID=1926491 RepID=UPI000B9AD740|nr:hypothetical protein [Hahella sp. CCB-MM4]OZG75182.1 hypothetical protein BTA51_02005 [Hahella sp. CCB-MM4]
MLIIGLPKERSNEFRVGLTPARVKELSSQGHKVVVECGAGQAADISDQEYEAAGAYLVEQVEHVFEIAHLIVKIIEPQGTELDMLRQGQVILAYPNEVTEATSTRNVVISGLSYVAYEAPSKYRGWFPFFRSENFSSSPMFMDSSLNVPA